MSSDPFTFQAFSWAVDDGDKSDHSRMDFTVHIFGKTQSGSSVAVHVRGYHPSFCVKFPENVSTLADYNDLHELLAKQLKTWEKIGGKLTETADFTDHLLDVPDREKIMRKKSLWGFSQEKNEPFFSFSFRSMLAYNKILGIFRACHGNKLSEEEMTSFYDAISSMVLVEDNGRKDYAGRNLFIEETSLKKGVPERVLRFIVKLGDAQLPFSFAKGRVFEHIDPILRFAHVRKLKMAGWITVLNGIPVKAGKKETTCDIELSARYENLDSIESDDISGKIKEMAFDIEAYSFNGLFPDPMEKENYCYQIGITMKNYIDKGFHTRILHCRTPESLREKGKTGYCPQVLPVTTICQRSGKVLSDCDREDCETIGHDKFDMETKVENFETERGLLLRFAEIIKKEDPDMIYAYNSDIFDWNYIMIRAQVTKCSKIFERLSRMVSYKCELKESKFNSSAYGDNKYMRVEIPGRLNIDLMIWVQRNMPADRYPSYSLDTVAEKEIDEKKRDVDVKEIFDAFKSGDTERLAKIAIYCGQDTVLVQKLVNKLDVVTQMFEMANITDTPPMYLLQKGQQIKCFSQIAKEAMEKGFLVPLADEREDGKFRGAIVLEPKIGKYDTPTAVLDFASLYPSIQVAYQVCYSTIVLDKELAKKLMQMKKDGKDLVLDGVRFDIIEWDEQVLVYENKETGKRMEFMNEDEGKKIQPKKEIKENMIRNNDAERITWRWQWKHYAYCFAQNQPSVIPSLQVKLKKSRKMVKGLMAPLEHSKDPEEQLRYRVLNGRQLAIKVSMNSIYGFTSAFMLNLRELSAAVTAMGRQMIEKTRDFVEKEFPLIAQKELWTETDVATFYTKAGKEVLAQVDEKTDEWVFLFRGEEVCREKRGVIPKDFIRKYPSAQLGKPWDGSHSHFCESDCWDNNPLGEAEHIKTDLMDVGDVEDDVKSRNKKLLAKLSLNVIGGDTDSIFCNFPNSTLAETISMCHKAADILTEKVFARAPIEMEYEKVYLPMVILKKKTYIGLKYEMDDVRWKIDYKGIAIKRRNYCDFVKKVFWGVIYPSLGVEKYLDEKNKTKMRKVSWDFKEGPSRAIEQLKRSLEELENGTVPMDLLVMSASLKSTYKGPTCSLCNGGKCMHCKGKRGGCSECKSGSKGNCDECGGLGKIVNLPHVQLAKRMKERDEGSAPISGQRFGYVIVRDDSRTTELWARSEDPKYAKQMNLTPDYLFYLDQQVRKPLTKFLTLVGKEAETEQVFLEVQASLFNKLKRERNKKMLAEKKGFFTAGVKRSAPLEKLKPPVKKMAKKDATAGHVSVATFFKKATLMNE
jgi:DNA polymerase elongation subunit (family B)